MKNYLFQNPSMRGYILIPRSLFEEVISKRNQKNKRNQTSVCYEEAFMIMLYMAYYSECKKGKYLLKRGESDLTAQEWGNLFGWSRGKVNIFFDYLKKQGQLSYNYYGKHRVIKLINYELFCGNQTIQKAIPEEKPMNKSQLLFHEFWESYHELTFMEPTEMKAAQRIWKKLSLQEKQMAINNIYDYLMRTELKKNLKKAYKYLSDKSFLRS